MTNDTMDTLDKQKYTPGEMYMILAVLYFFPPQLEIFYFPQIQQGQVKHRVRSEENTNEPRNYVPFYTWIY